MLKIARPLLALCAAAGLLLAACQAAPTVLPTATPVNVTNILILVVSVTPSIVPTTTPPFTPTAPPASATAAASATLAPSPTRAPTLTPTASLTPTATRRPTALATRAPVTITPLGPPVSNAVYSTTSGPPGFASTLKCLRAGAACAPVMPPGDVSFQMTLASTAQASWTHFVNYGLAVEKDGANVAGDFMFVDAGWLQPGALVSFGASRAFTQPGVYVIRSSGCLTTDLKSTACEWATIGGDVVTFTIQ